MPTSSQSYDVLFVLCVNGLGGAELSMLSIAEGLAEQGLSVGLILYGSKPELLQARTTCPVFILNIERTSHVFPALWKTIKTLKPACIISALPHTNIITLLAAKLANSSLPVILTEHCSFAAPAKHKGNFLRWLIRYLYPFATKVIAVSESLKNELKVIAPHAVVQVIYNPVIEPRPAIDNTAPHAWLAANIPVIIAAGRLAPQKAFGDLLHAFALLLKRQKARLIILGEGEERTSLETLAKTLGIAEHVLLPGFVKDIYPWLKYAKLFVSSSHYEGFGNVIVEALDAGIPVIATDCPVGPAEILGDDKWGHLVPVGDAAALAAKIEEVLKMEYDPVPGQLRAQDFTRAHSVAAYKALLHSL